MFTLLSPCFTVDQTECNEKPTMHCSLIIKKYCTIHDFSGLYLKLLKVEGGQVGSFFFFCDASDSHFMDITGI